MATLTTGNSASFDLIATDCLTVSCSQASDVAQVMSSTGFIGAPQEIGKVVGAKGRRFGPYGKPVSLVVNSISGSITAEVTPNSIPGPVSNTGGGIATALGTDKTVAASDDGKTYLCTAALTATFPAGLSPKPSVIFVPPASGNLSIAFSGGATGNGATTTLTRTRANNLVGVAVVAYPETDAYGVGGQ